MKDYSTKTFAINSSSYFDEEIIAPEDFEETSFWYDKKSQMANYSNADDYFSDFYDNKLSKLNEAEYVDFFIELYEEFERLYTQYDGVWALASAIRNVSSYRYSQEFADKTGLNSNIGENLKFSHEERKRLIELILTKKAKNNMPSSSQDSLNSVIQEMTGVWVGYYQNEDLTKLDALLK